MRRAEAKRLYLPKSKRKSVPGAPPGSVVVHDDALASVVDAIAYGPQRAVSRQGVSLDEIPDLVKDWPVVWINVVGLGSAEVINGLGDLFDLHGLALEDVVNVHQRPKVEDYDDYAFIVAHMLHDDDGAQTEQVSMFLGKDLVVTFQEKPGDCFGAVRDRLLHGKGRIRREGADYLAYALIDAIVDGYFGPVESYGDRIEQLEEMAVVQPSKALVSRIHEVRRDLSVIRKSIWSTREMVAALSRDTLSAFREPTRIYLRDCHDHTIQLLDMTETYRELAASLFELYLSMVSNRLNDIMRLLAIIATIFMPMGVVAGIYGMNFKPEASPLNMPELNWAWGYPYALGLMALVGLAMVYMFWRKKWIGRAA